MIVDAPATGQGIGFLQTPRTFAGIARVGPIHAQAQELDRFITDHDATGVAIVSLPEEMPVNESASLEESLTDEIGMSVDRVYMNALYPERFSNSEATELEEALERADGPARAAVRAALSEHRRCRSQREQLQRLKQAVVLAGQDPALHLQAAARRAIAGAPRRGARSDGHDHRHRRRPRDLHLRRLGRRGQDDHLGGAGRRAGRARTEGLRADDRPRQAAGRLAGPGGAREHAQAGRSGALRAGRRRRCEASSGR